MRSYAQNFEDVMLARLFDGKTDGFYIDVGAWDPNDHSVTRHFYDLGWHGINVEPIRARHAMFDEERPRDINLNIAISEQEGQLTFFECEEESYLSTADPATAEDMRKRGLTVTEHTIPSVPLASVIEQHAPSRIDFLKVDVEGLELQVLRSADLARYRPRVLVIESVVQATPPASWERPEEIGNWDEWENVVLSQGYVFAYFDGLNRFYVADDEAHLARRFALPPCVFDEISLAREVDLLHSELEKRLSVIHELDAAVQAFRAGAEAHATEVNRLDQRIQELQTACDERDQAIAALSARIGG